MVTKGGGVNRMGGIVASRLTGVRRLYTRASVTQQSGSARHLISPRRITKNTLLFIFEKDPLRMHTLLSLREHTPTLLSSTLRDTSQQSTFESNPYPIFHSRLSGHIRSLAKSITHSRFSLDPVISVNNSNPSKHGTNPSNPAWLVHSKFLFPACMT